MIKKKKKKEGENMEWQSINPFLPHSSSFAFIVIQESFLVDSLTAKIIIDIAISTAAYQTS
jgi:hypothetical protein